jgi:HEAT repeat protein
MDQRLQRKRDLETHIEDCLSLQRDLEESLGLEKDPKRKRALKKDIEEQKELRAKYLSELESFIQDINQDTLAKYLSHLIERNTYLHPRGVMQTHRQVSLKLDEIYISLKAERELSGRGRLDRRAGLPHVGLSGEPIVSLSGEPVAGLSVEEEVYEWIGPGGRAMREMFSRDSLTEQVEFSAAVREHSRIVVLGDPGAGKTTLLRFLALQFAQAYRDGKPAVSGEDGAEYGETRLPIFFRVADYAEAFANNKTLRLAEFLATPFKDIAPEPAIASLFNDALKRGQAFVMLDGLDEVIDTSGRALIAGRIEDFVAGLDDRNRVIVTSRIVGYREVPLGGDCHHFTLLDLERDQIEQFLRNWCHETERFLSKDASKEEIARNAQREIDSILHAVDNNPGVKRLAVNPLLLTILALIHRNGSRLPNRRVELYDLAAKTLLETWQIERMDAGKFNIREGEASQFLWPLAYWLHSEKPSGMATEQEIKYQLAKFLAATRNQEPDHPEIIAAADDFLRRVRHHTGLLVERAPNQYGFMHLTFEEYFAARELVRRPERVAKKIYALRHQPRWQEPILLAIAYLSEAFPNMPGDIIRSAILAEGADDEEEDFAPSLYEDVLHRDLLFAAQCIGDCVTIEPALRRQVVERLVKLYLDPTRAGKYQTLRVRIAEALNYLRNSEAANEAAEMAQAALQDDNEEVRISAAWALGELKVDTPEVVNGLLAALRDGKAQVRRSAVDALGKMGGSPNVVSGLLAALRDEKGQARGWAALALGEVKVGTREVVSGLLATLRDEKAQARRWAAKALGELKVDSPEVVSGLLAALRDEEEHVRGTAARALGELKVDSPEVVSGLLAALRDEKEHVRSWTAWALGKMGGSPNVVNRLLAALRDERAEVRRSAVDALGKMGSGPEVVSGLLTALRDEKEKVRSSAARALGKMGGGPEVVSRLLTALRDEKEKVRSSAVEALGELKVDTPEVVSGLLTALRDEKEDVRSSVPWALGKMGGSPELVSGLLAALQDEKEEVRRWVPWALGEVKAGGPEVVSGLLAALRDEKEEIRGSAARALGELKVSAPEVVSGLLAALRDERAEVRGWAALALGEVKAGAPEVVSGLLAALRDEKEQVRGFAAWALGELSKDRKSELSQRLSHQIADTLREMFDDPRNQEREPISAGGWYYLKPVDAIWEALWLMCQRMDEQRG